MKKPTNALLIQCIGTQYSPKCLGTSDISHAILGYIFSTFYQYARLESSYDMCIQVEQPKQALFQTFHPISKPSYHGYKFNQ
jgi:hypothetical protein